MVLAPSGTQDHCFRELPALLDSGDLLVLNETKVITARLFGRRVRGDLEVELLLLHPAGSLRYDAAAVRWVALARPARRLREGDTITFSSPGEARVTAVFEDGMRELEFSVGASMGAFLAQAGRMPLPPYIRNESAEAQARYQTVFARIPGSVAAPTASLHFTPELLDEIEARGIEIARISLDVGLGTFRPVASERIDDHSMHPEAYTIPPPAAAAIERVRLEKRRIVAAGTTVVRALEGNFERFGRIEHGEDVTDLFIRPGFRFKVVRAMITNFHLPRSTLLMLVSAFAGRERTLDAYRDAIRKRYRFYSFGDAMLVTT
jgi:S-adenosylmethionine:tRNA ribosyltransferase-isomerase